MTQWSRMERNQALPASQNGDITNTSPGAGAFSAFANTTMETFDQRRPQLGCMSCHNQARLGRGLYLDSVGPRVSRKICSGARRAA